MAHRKMHQTSQMPELTAESTAAPEAELLLRSATLPDIDLSEEPSLSAATLPDSDLNDELSLSAATLPDIDLIDEPSMDSSVSAEVRRVIQPDIVLNTDLDSAPAASPADVAVDVPVDVAAVPPSDEMTAVAVVSQARSVLQQPAILVSHSELQDAPALPQPPRPLGALGRIWRRVHGYIRKATQAVLKPLRRRS